MQQMPPFAATGSRGLRPAINGACAPEAEGVHSPRRLQRTRKRFNFTPRGAVYVGRPTWWNNPFERRSGICHSRSVILYRHWLAGHLSPYILACARFSEAEIASLRRWRDRLLRSLDHLRGKDLQCWCPLTSAWCHADVLLAVANR